MRKTTIALLSVLAVAMATSGIYIWNALNKEPVVFNPLTATYDLDGMQIALMNGKAEQLAVDDATSTINTRVFGEPFFGDLTGDGKNDATLFIYQNPGGTGTFFYVAAAINDGNNAKTTKAVLLGDRITPQSTIILDGEMIVNYLIRDEGEPFTAAPSVAMSRRFIVKDGLLKEIQ